MDLSSSIHKVYTMPKESYDVIAKKGKRLIEDLNKGLNRDDSSGLEVNYNECVFGEIRSTSTALADLIEAQVDRLFILKGVHVMQLLFL